jgi:hypothetical protein
MAVVIVGSCLPIIVSARPASAASSFNISNYNTGHCVAARAGSGERPGIATTCDFTVKASWADQHWSFPPAAYGTVQIKSDALGLCLVARGSTETQAVATTCGGWADQLWTVKFDSTTNTYQYVNYNSGLCLASRAGSGEPPVIATTCDFAVNTVWADQHWRQSPAGTYPSVSPPLGVSAVGNTVSTFRVSWPDETFGQGSYDVYESTGATYYLGNGVTSFTAYGFTPAEYVCFRVAAVWGGIQSAWSGEACATTPSYDTPYNWFGSTSTSGSPQTDPINMILTASSQVNLGQLYNVLHAQQGVPYTDPAGLTVYAQWDEVTQDCLNTIYTDISGSWLPEDFAAREFGCGTVVFDPLADPWDHFRAWNYDGASYIAASTEHFCVPQVHCAVDFNAGRDLLLSDIRRAAASNGWVVNIDTTPQPYSPGTINGAPYDGHVDVITLTLS